MRISAYLSNREWFLAVLCGAVAVPVGIWILAVVFKVLECWK